LECNRIFNYSTLDLKMLILKELLLLDWLNTRPFATKTIKSTRATAL
jgi:hypothetical protein